MTNNSLSQGITSCCEWCRKGHFDIHICNIGRYFLCLFKGIVTAGLQFVRRGLNRKNITQWLSGENHVSTIATYPFTWYRHILKSIGWNLLYEYNLCSYVCMYVCVYQCLRDSTKLSASTSDATETRFCASNSIFKFSNQWWVFSFSTSYLFPKVYS